jgi:hypothetical protein
MNEPKNRNGKMAKEPNLKGEIHASQAIIGIYHSTVHDKLYKNMQPAIGVEDEHGMEEGTINLYERQIDLKQGIASTILLIAIQAIHKQEDKEIEMDKIINYAVRLANSLQCTYTAKFFRGLIDGECNRYNDGYAENKRGKLRTIMMSATARYMSNAIGTQFKMSDVIKNTDTLVNFINGEGKTQLPLIWFHVPNEAIRTPRTGMLLKLIGYGTRSSRPSAGGPEKGHADRGQGGTRETIRGAGSFPSEMR